jgi:cytidylate kinase
MVPASQIVAIEGNRGTGKSTLASRLREAFGVGVLDVGVLFRLIAWQFTLCPVRGVTDAVVQIRSLIEDRDLVLDLFRPMKLAATCVILRNCNDVERLLWSREVDDVLRNAAEDDVAIGFVRALVNAYSRDGRLIVVGRRVAGDFCDSNAIVLHLSSEIDIRHARKRMQLNGARLDVPERIDDADPRASSGKVGCGIVVRLRSDVATPDHIFQLAARVVEGRAHWRPYTQSVSSQ